VPRYFASPIGKSLISGQVKIGNYFNFNYKDGSSSECPPDPAPTPTPSPTPSNDSPTSTPPVPGATPIPVTPFPTPTSTPFYTWDDTCDGIAKAANELKHLIESRGANAPKVTIVAHSMGGVISAYLIASGDKTWVKDHIASVITFDSPHQGVPTIKRWIKAATSYPIRL
jgi:pimeloyl-ACP methyl ester carboxylesterase